MIIIIINTIPFNKNIDFAVSGVEPLNENLSNILVYTVSDSGELLPLDSHVNQDITEVILFVIDKLLIFMVLLITVD